MDVVALVITNTCNLLQEKRMYNIIAMEPFSLNGFIEFQSRFDYFEIKMIYDSGEIITIWSYYRFTNFEINLLDILP